MRATAGLCWSDTVPEYPSGPAPVLTDGLPGASPQQDTPRLRQSVREPTELFLPSNEAALLAALRRPQVRPRPRVERFKTYADWLDRGVTKKRAAFEADIDARTAFRYSRRLREGERPYPTVAELAAWEVPYSGTPPRTVLLRRASYLPDVIICALDRQYSGLELIPVEFDPSVTKQRPWVDAFGVPYRTMDCGAAGLTPRFDCKYHQR